MIPAGTNDFGMRCSSPGRGATRVEGRPVLVFSCLGAGLSDERRKAGELTDPMPVGWAADGSALELNVVAPVTDATPGQSS